MAKMQFDFAKNNLKILGSQKTVDYCCIGPVSWFMFSEFEW
jgi:hypothetical protein